VPEVGVSRAPRICIKVDLPTGWSHDGHEFAVLDGERYAAQGVRGYISGHIGFDDIFDLYHMSFGSAIRYPPILMAPAAPPPPVARTLRRLRLRRYNHKIHQLSGDKFARASQALVNNRRSYWPTEPTGNWNRTIDICRTFQHFEPRIQAHHRLITHEADIAAHADRIVESASLIVGDSRDHEKKVIKL